MLSRDRVARSSIRRDAPWGCMVGSNPPLQLKVAIFMLRGLRLCMPGGGLIICLWGSVN